ncbi:dTDP-4-dehydrorhamnose 3,5-epimerase family protein [Thiorhodococcus minor]|uniref:dTDP-4-dehydrorhamnose 3,5-epimerase n=1 Tax=Thiorhodococcus minor TaxID=57489 RepID=A0A6M0JUE0_9GAMM|nr:dTDP-4-dehydrorhamnose 3,5-epimerase family protein [Thiorhodococcus minor]NEV60541.1 dTDP-4-keto-6-deoxy-D-glucose epimerase [Thiorhodococcus minor]
MSARFRKHATEIAGIVSVERLPIGDERGFFERVYCAGELESLTGGRPIVQINRTLTHRKGTVRGLHFQYPPDAEIKLVSCLRGEVLDVAVDLRAGSPTFLRWHAERLSALEHRMLIIPEGCAHGFQTLVDDSELLYLHTAAHAPAAEAGVHPEDPALAIRWLLPVAELSSRDAGHPWIAKGFQGVSL